MPVPVSGLSSGVVALASGALLSCALLTGGSLRCWGQNANGQLGDGTTTSRAAPVAVSGLSSGVAAVSANLFLTCALKTNGSLRCWGDNSWLQLGSGSSALQSSVPLAVIGFGPVTVPALSARQDSCYSARR